MGWTEAQRDPAPSEALRFNVVLRKNLSAGSEQGDGIGTLGQKRMHAIWKDYYCSDRSCQEIRVEPKTGKGRYIADVLSGDTVTEVQTGSLSSLRNKIDWYLTMTDYKIRVVHPIVPIRWVHWIEPDTGKIGPKRRSPKKEGIDQIVRELYWMIPHLDEARISFVFPMVETEDFKLRNGWGKDKKRGAERYERIPVKLLSFVNYEKPEDYLTLLPDGGLPEVFTAADLSRQMRGTESITAYTILKILSRLGYLESAGTVGHSAAFRLTTQ